MMDGWFQHQTAAWVESCMGTTALYDWQERALRFVEEALELGQSSRTLSREQAHALVDYVFDREVGHPWQEVGGVMVTLAAMAHVMGFDMFAAGHAELVRCIADSRKIAEKQAAKPKGVRPEVRSA